MTFVCFFFNKVEDPHINETRKDLIKIVFLALGYSFGQSYTWMLGKKKYLYKTLLLSESLLYLRFTHSEKLLYINMI